MAGFERMTASTASPKQRCQLLDEFLPAYDVSDSVATVVEADIPTTWDALMDVDLIEVGRRRPMVAALGALRALPDVISHRAWPIAAAGATAAAIARHDHDPFREGRLDSPRRAGPG